MRKIKPPRIKPLKPDQWDAEMLDALGAFPAGLNFVMASRQQGEDLPRGSNVLGAMALHPALAKAFLTFNAHIAMGTQLSARARELAIIRISWLKVSEYELAQHLILGRRAGLTEDEIRRLQHDHAPGRWSPEDRCVLLAVDELHDSSRIGDATWTQVKRHFRTAQILDLIFLVGCYSTLAMALNSICLPLEPSAKASEPSTENTKRTES